jgi:hypothetical protein
MTRNLEPRGLATAELATPGESPLVEDASLTPVTSRPADHRHEALCRAPTAHD